MTGTGYRALERRVERGRGQILDDGSAWHDEPAPTGLHQLCCGHRHRARAGKRHGQQPVHQLAAGGREIGEASCLAQFVEVREAGLKADPVGGARLWRGASTWSATKRSEGSGRR